MHSLIHNTSPKGTLFLQNSNPYNPHNSHLHCMGHIISLPTIIPTHGFSPPDVINLYWYIRWDSISLCEGLGRDMGWLILPALNHNSTSPPESEQMDRKLLYISQTLLYSFAQSKMANIKHTLISDLGTKEMHKLVGHIEYLYHTRH